MELWLWQHSSSDTAFTHLCSCLASPFARTFVCLCLCENELFSHARTRNANHHSSPLTHVLPHLHIRVNGEANSEANDECTNYIFASSFIVSFATPFMGLDLDAVFEHKSKETNGLNGSFALTCTNMWMFVHMWKQFIYTETETYECSCKWWGKARARICKCDIRKTASRVSVTNGEQCDQVRRFYAKLAIFKVFWLQNKSYWRMA